jgi:catechol 2,3-dioxygenase-like lactoylglutathione lyase family enzyme
VKVLNVRWVGVATREYEAMFDFLHRVLGLEVAFAEETTAEFATAEGDTVQIMAPGDRYFGLFSEQARGPVPLFEVDDVHTARAELAQAGVELVGVHPGGTSTGIGSTSAHPTATCTSSPAGTDPGGGVGEESDGGRTGLWMVSQGFEVVAIRLRR